MARNIRLILQYDGSRYHGWQKHDGVCNTIQGRIEQVLERMGGKPVELVGSGRTDAGVHARAQTANFYYEGEETPARIKDYLNRYLPEDIGVLSAEEVPMRFHSRFGAIRKTYEYRVYVGAEKPVFDRKYIWTPDKLSGFDVGNMRAAAVYLVGEHDFLAFCGNRNFKKSSVRRIERAEVTSDGTILHFRFTGSGFLQNMVRILTGTLLEVGAGLRTPESVAEALAKKDRSLAGFMAPAKGLTLISVEYE
ncbi:MAG: tRNA pseudouridine(38-40) synthase TruA [Lachnospiraceae bacterium]|nr:tRNA pseudouridine(38-40) synthase TruA [Lachnospiraceae bacterium]